VQRFVAGRIFRVAKILFKLEYKTKGNLPVNKETVIITILNLKIHQLQAVTLLKLPKKYPKNKLIFLKSQF